MKLRESAVTKVLDTIIEPRSGRSLSSIGALQSLKIVEREGQSKFNVQIDLDMLVPGHPALERLYEDVERGIRNLDWVSDVCVSALRRRPQSRAGGIAGQASATRHVEHVVAVSSCKGGVGKSTVAVGLALSLAKRGLRVGLLDADIYGPSLPAMLRPRDPAVRKADRPGVVHPLIGPHGLKMLSFGFVSPSAGVQGAGGRGAAVLRGPIASRVVTQLVAGTEWGDLDYLIVDMPPGTGDVQITLCQSLPLTGAVVVTTPHDLSLTDAAKGIAMFQNLKVPTLALVSQPYCHIAYLLLHNVIITTTRMCVRVCVV
jgi:Mrp family chromosome partitioning ATPase